jgi:hypothetical protein
MALDLDAIRRRLDHLALPVWQGSNAVWQLRHNRDHAIGMARDLLAEVERLRELLPWDGNEPPPWQEIAEGLARRLSAAETVVKKIRDDMHDDWQAIGDHQQPGPMLRHYRDRLTAAVDAYQATEGAGDE